MKNALFLISLVVISVIIVGLMPLAVAEPHSIGGMIDARLSYMKDVAGDKAQHHQPIEDLAQESRVLEKAVADAVALGLRGDTVTPFIQAQMDAAKAIQYRYRADWLSVPETGWHPRPLGEVREKIGQLSHDILQKVAQRLTSGGPLTDEEKAGFLQDIQQQNMHDQDKLLIWHALKKVSLNQH